MAESQKVITANTTVTVTTSIQILSVPVYHSDYDGDELYVKSYYANGTAYGSTIRINSGTTGTVPTPYGGTIKYSYNSNLSSSGNLATNIISTTTLSHRVNCNSCDCDNNCD